MTEEMPGQLALDIEESKNSSISNEDLLLEWFKKLPIEAQESFIKNLDMLGMMISGQVNPADVIKQQLPKMPVDGVKPTARTNGTKFNPYKQKGKK